MAKTSIEWATDVWNPVTGCQKVSQGCKHCYAERIAERFWGARKFTDVQVHPERLAEPLKWRKPRRVFVNSMSDLFHENIYDGNESFLNEVFAVMAATPRHTYLVLTKRPVIMRNYLSNKRREVYIEHSLETIYGEHGWCSPDFQWPLPNVWLGVSVEDQKAADERIPLLLQTPAAVRFVSCEPLLGPVELTKIKWAKIKVNPESYRRLGVPAPDEMWSLNNALISHPADEYNPAKIGLDWVIVGGESGPGARPMHPDWPRSLRDQCQAQGTPFFFKQWGEYSEVGKYVQQEVNWVTTGTMMQRVGKKAAGRLLDGREHNEFPQTREYQVGR
jgi:protein gp37